MSGYLKTVFRGFPLFAGAFLWAWLGPSGAWALYPMQSFQDLVAGNGTSGYADGPFYSALFHAPQGLAFNDDGTQLYVCDRDNNRIRMVDLENANQVTTLAGNGKPGYADGPLLDALFNRPTALAVLPNQRIAVYDNGNALIRLIDLNKKTVTTLAGNKTDGWSDGDALKASLGEVWSMVYLPSRDGLYFTQPGFGTLRKLDLKTGKVLTIFRGKPEAPQPGALAVGGGDLFLADKSQDQVYRLSPKDKFAQEDDKSFDWTALSKGLRIQNMAWSGGVLYAAQQDRNAPLARLTPQYQPVTFVSIWGDTQTTDPFVFSLFWDVDLPDPVFVAADPASERKLYFSHPRTNIITSYRDLYLQENKFAEAFNQDGLTDFRYPTAKPAHTFRILVVGDSHTFHQFDADVKKRGWEFYNRFATLSKRTEETLNTLAALEDVPTHYEVLHCGQVGGNHQIVWPYHLVPDLVKKFDIDLVINFFTPGVDLDPFYQWPYDAEGVPTQGSPEYTLKPYQERLQPGLPKEIFDLCQDKKLVSTDNGQVQFASFDQLNQYPDITDKIAQLMARPMKILAEKLGAMRTRDGNAVRMEVVIIPAGEFGGTGPIYDFWRKVIQYMGTPTFDFVSPLTALKISYYPFSERGGSDHFSADGHLLLGFLLAHELIQDKLIPFEPRKK